MRLSIALSAMAGGLALGWASLAGAASPPASAPPTATAPPAAPIFYCPTPPAGRVSPATTPAHAATGGGCPTAHHVATAEHHVRRHVELATRERPHAPPEPPPRGAATGHMFWYRYEQALNRMGPSCPTWRHPCPPEPNYPIVREIGPPAPPAIAMAPLPPPAPPEPPCHHPHHSCPQLGPDAYAEAQPPRPTIIPSWACPRAHHDCPPAAPYVEAAPPLIQVAPPAPGYDHEAWLREQRRDAHEAREDAYADREAPPAPPPPHLRPVPPPHDEGYREHREDVGPPAYAYREQREETAPPPAYAYREDQGEERQGYTYQRSESEHSSGWSYSEDDGQGQSQHWDDGDAHRPPPCPRADHRCGPAAPPPYANGAAQWQDGSYGQVYGVSGRNAQGYLVWPGKSPQ
jgi:hypothetical protein